jgi:hypothetical protein
MSDERREALIQYWLGAVHLAAAGMAVAWALTHVAAAEHHLRRAVAQETAETADEYVRRLARRRQT